MAEDLSPPEAPGAFERPPAGDETSSHATRRVVIAAALAGVGAVAIASARPAAWPDGAALTMVPLPPMEGRPLRVYLDAGHGAHDNPGNRGAFCQMEEAFTLGLSHEVGAWLEERGFDVRVSRDPGQSVDYRARVADAEAWGADVFVSLHSDVRGVGAPWHPRSTGPACPRSREAPGFSVLWSDASPRGGDSHRLARAVADAMRESGLPAYDGRHYGDTYELDDDAPGVFVDRHAPGERIFVLWRPAMPSVLIETHHALDDREVKRWSMPETQRAFAAAVGAALLRARAQRR